MGGLQASLGLSQIKSLERTIKLKRKQEISIKAF